MPGWYDWRSPVWSAFFSLPFGLRAERCYKSLPELPEGGISDRLPALSIIIPARDEEVNLSLLLPQLQRSVYPGDLEIVVVNDHSTDRTMEVARCYGVRLINLSDGLAPGWLGKPYACHQGALAAHGEWLMFTDADTRHCPTAAARCVDYACRNSLDGVSLFVRQECNHFLDRMALATAYAGLFAGYGPENHMLNGQYILLRRDAYRESGGFEAVRGHVLEDVALGNYLARQGYRVPLLRGEKAAAVSMYSSRKQMAQGITRLSSEWLRYSGSGILANSVFITATLSPLMVLIGILRGKVDRRWLLPSWGAVFLATVPWYRRFGSSWQAALAPFGALLIVAASLWGIAARLLNRGVPWRGRRVIARKSAR